MLQNNTRAFVPKFYLTSTHNKLFRSVSVGVHTNELDCEQTAKRRTAVIKSQN